MAAWTGFDEGNRAEPYTFRDIQGGFSSEAQRRH